MARFRADEVEHYGGQGGGGYFSLKKDKDTAQIRFLYNGVDDIEGLSVHKIQIGDKKRYVNCLREYNDPVDTCPFCRERMTPAAKLFIPIYNVSQDKIQVWERGKKFFQKMSSLCSRYPDLVSHIFEIERNGISGDTSTTYEIYEVDQDDTTLDDFEIPETVGGVVLDKTAEDMEYYLESGEFPPEEGERPRRRENREEAPRRREQTSERRSERAGRRTPARRSTNDEDVY